MTVNLLSSNVLEWIKVACQSLTDCLFPPTCLGCHDLLAPSQQDLCANCWVCFEKMSCTDKSVSRRLPNGLPLHWSSAPLYFTPKSRVARLLYGLKYRYNPGAALRLGRWCGRAFSNRFSHQEVDLILPVPLHPLRASARGYNQSERLAQGIAEVIERPSKKKWLIRVRNTPSQSQLSGSQRFQNVANGFQLTEKAAVKGRHILLVDDLLTSGATIMACIAPLMEAQVGKISLAVLAITK